MHLRPYSSDNIPDSPSRPGLAMSAMMSHHLAVAFRLLALAASAGCVRRSTAHTPIPVGRRVKIVVRGLRASHFELYESSEMTESADLRH